MTRPIVITGGGTGGHIFPMSAIAEALASLGEQPNQLRFVGSRRGQEWRLLGDGPIALTLLPGRGIRRSLRPRALAQNVGAVLGLLAGLVQAVVIVGRWRPRAVVSVGGYASFPVSAAAVLWRRPLVLVDLDATPPATHRVLQRFAARRCVALGEPSASTVVTGAPVRDAIAAIDRSEEGRRHARTKFSPPIDASRQVVVVMTGSLGASSVNRAVMGVAALWRERDDITLVHVTGRRDEAWVCDGAPTTVGLDYRILSFADMVPLWQVADVAVCRAGATTTAELTTIGLASILVPLPGAPGDHQGENARALARAGAALVLPDAELSPEKLAATITFALQEPLHSSMAQAAKSLGKPVAARAIALAVTEVAR